MGGSDISQSLAIGLDLDDRFVRWMLIAVNFCARKISVAEIVAGQIVLPSGP